MKRPIFIIIGTILVIFLLAVWLYVLFFGSPENSPEGFSLFNFGDTTDLTFDPNATSTETEAVLVDVNGNEPLRQLTTKPVVGKQEVVENASSSPVVTFIEAGTGHIYQINLDTGEELRISGTTIPGAWNGAITPNGQYVMIQSGTGNASKILLGKLKQSDNTLETRELEEAISSIHTTPENTFLYAVQNNSSVEIKQYFPISNISEGLFTIPYREAVIAWGKSADSTHLIYPKVHGELEGFVFEAKNKNLQRLPIDGFGLSAISNQSYVLYSTQDRGKYQTYLHEMSSGDKSSLSYFIAPEKCVSLATRLPHFICASNLLEDHKQFTLDRWYQGAVRYDDDLWLLEPKMSSLEVLADIESLTGRQLDIEKPTLNQTESRLYFINKNDQTLWLFEVPPTILLESNE
jgi:hypothetical protein